jgi:hypothetical protein
MAGCASGATAGLVLDVFRFARPKMPLSIIPVMVGCASGGTDNPGASALAINNDRNYIGSNLVT